MSQSQRMVIDTNVLLSRLLGSPSIPGRAVTKASRNTTLVSEYTMNELADVLARPKFDPYITLHERQQFLRQLGRLAEFVPIVSRVHICRDPKDDKFLELALNGRADLILTGDGDLLALNPWRDIEIVSPAESSRGIIDDHALDPPQRSPFRSHHCFGQRKGK